MLTWILKDELDFYAGRSTSLFQAEGREEIKIKGMTTFPGLGNTEAQVQNVWWV